MDVQTSPRAGPETPPSLTFHRVATGWALSAEVLSQLGLHPVLPRMTLHSFILSVQVSAKGTQMEREKSGLGLDRGKNLQNVNLFILEKS